MPIYVLTSLQLFIAFIYISSADLDKVIVSLSDGDFLIGPCRSQRLGRRQELAIGQAGPGTKGIIGKVPGPRVHPVDTSVFNPFPWKGR